MGQLVITNNTGMTLPYDVWICNTYGNDCVLVATINTTIPPTITIELPPIFNTYPALTIKLTNGINCDYFETIYCS